MAIKKDLTSGKWFYYGKYINFKGENKQYKKRGFNTKSEAKKKEQLFLLTVGTANKEMTLDELYAEYSVFASQYLKDSTLYNDKKKYKKISDIFGHKLVNKITSKDILLWQQDLLQKDYSISYINSIRNTFSKLYTYLYQNHNIDYNPLKRVPRPKKPNDLKKTNDFWTYQEFSSFISVVKNPEYLTLFTLAYMSGCRKGELLALQWNDYDGESININKTFSPITLKCTPPKTKNSYRNIYLDNKTVNLLNTHKELCSSYDGYNLDKYIFGFNKPITTTTLERSYKKYQIEANVKKIRFHDLRHSHASLLIDKKMPITIVASRLGDNVETVLNTYTHLLSENHTKVVDILNNL